MGDQPGKSKPSPNMRFSSLLTASMASVVAGQGLTQTLMNQPSLSNLTTYLNLFPTLLNELSSMSNITLLAPSNMAFETALNSSTGAAFTANNTDVISALFSYHVLNGSYTNFSTMPEFVHTALMPGPTQQRPSTRVFCKIRPWPPMVPSTSPEVLSMWLTTSWSCQKTSPTLLSNSTYVLQWAHSPLPA